MVEINLRIKTGVTLLAFGRSAEVIEHTEPETVLRADNIAYLFVNPEQANFETGLFQKTKQ